MRQSEATSDSREVRQDIIAEERAKVNLDRKLVFPNNMETTLWPDTVLVSQQSRPLAATEPTMLWEEHCEWDMKKKCRNKLFKDIAVSCCGQVVLSKISMEPAQTTRDMWKRE